jgi:anti-sigma B factor antagonist
MLFDFSISEQPACLILSLSGELIEKNQAIELLKKADELVASGKTKIAINLADLKYMNSSGLNTMIQLLTTARKDGGEVVICNMNKKINELLLITKLHTLFKVVETEADAITFFSN